MRCRSPAHRVEHVSLPEPARALPKRGRQGVGITGTFGAWPADSD